MRLFGRCDVLFVSSVGSMCYSVCLVVIVILLNICVVVLFGRIGIVVWLMIVFVFGLVVILCSVVLVLVLLFSMV